MIKTYVTSLELQYFFDKQLVFNCLFVGFYVLFIDMDSTNYYIFIKYVWIMIYLLILYIIHVN
jgi:hypothetical protein